MTMKRQVLFPIHSTLYQAKVPKKLFKEITSCIWHYPSILCGIYHVFVKSFQKFHLSRAHCPKQAVAM